MVEGISQLLCYVEIEEVLDAKIQNSTMFVSSLSLHLRPNYYLTRRNIK